MLKDVRGYEENMVQASQSTVLWVVGLIAALFLVVGFFAYGNLSDKVDANKPLPVTPVVVPTAAQIAAAVAPLLPEPTATSTRGGSSSSDNVDDVLQGVYPALSNQIRNDCIADLYAEYSMDDRMDMIRDLIEDSTGEQIYDLVVLDWNYNNEYDLNILNLGLDDRADRAAEITSTVRVSYKFEDGNQDDVKDKVYALATCNDWDVRDSEFQNVNVEFTL